MYTEIANLYHRILSEDVMVPTLKATLLDAVKPRVRKAPAVKPTRNERRAEAAWKRYCEKNGLNDAGVKIAA
ncbi:MAG: hypothetical protein E7317_04560 [Clostridiales bacterium]|nr:hypothetical protein [Clostridiales bacterium]